LLKIVTDALRESMRPRSVPRVSCAGALRRADRHCAFPGPILAESRGMPELQRYRRTVRLAGQVADTRCRALPVIAAGSRDDLPLRNRSGSASGKGGGFRLGSRRRGRSSRPVHSCRFNGVRRGREHRGLVAGGSRPCTRRSALLVRAAGSLRASFADRRRHSGAGCRR
jgi:hypothetical protein